MNEHLFLGGSADQTLRQVEDSALSELIPVRVAMADGQTKQFLERYLSQDLRVGGSRVRVFVREGLSDIEILGLWAKSQGVVVESE